MIAWLQEHAIGAGITLVWLLAIYSAVRAILYAPPRRRRLDPGPAADADRHPARLLDLRPYPLPRLRHAAAAAHARADEALAQREQLEAVLQPRRGRHAQLHTLARRLGAGGFTRGNRLELLIDGEATFAAMLAAIAGRRSRC